MARQWVNVTKKRPCSICGRGDWCSVSTDGLMAMCRRVDGGKHGVDGAGFDFWIYRLDGGIEIDPVEIPACPSVDRADAETLDAVYRYLLGLLTLSAAHRNNLLERGLQNIDQYRTLPSRERSRLARAVAEKFGADLLPSVPGFYIKKDGAEEYFSLAGSPGILIPVYNMARQIVALKVRADKSSDDFPRYSYLSSSKHGGPSPGAPVHIPLASSLEHAETVRITEGELKADVATAISGLLTVSIPGVSSWRAMLPILPQIGAKKVILSFDADGRDNPYVAKALQRASEGLRDAGYTVAVEVWDPALGKGIDDLLAAGHAPQVLEDQQAAAAIESFMESSGADPLRHLKPENVFDAEIIGALALLKQEDPADYAQRKQGLKGKVNLNDLERAVNSKIREKSHLQIVRDGDKPKTLEQILPKITDQSMRQIAIPYGWIFGLSGVRTETKSGVAWAAPVPVLLTRRLRDVDSGEEKIEVSYYRDQVWHRCIAARSVAFTRQGIVSLADRGLPVSSESSKWLVRWFEELERTNLDTLPLVKSTAHMGWVGKSFWPGAEGDIELEQDDSGISEGYKATGTLRKWIACMQPIREHYLARFALAASFAAPLLNLTGQRVFLIHFWGPSRGSKSAVVQAALSVWGEPETIMASFNTTMVALERMAAYYNDLPLGVDEKQIAGDRQKFIESLVYLLGMGKGKGRGSKTGGLQRFSRWRTIVLTNGEEPISTESSNTGINTRVLELWGKPLPEDLGSALYGQIAANHGTAGPEYIRWLITALGDNPAMVTDDYKAMLDALKAEYPNNIPSHLAAVAIVCVADYYISRQIFGAKSDDPDRDADLDDQAIADALQLGRSILSGLDTVQESDFSERAYEFVWNWLLSYTDQFSDGAKPPRYGIMENGIYYVLPHLLEAALEGAGFSARRVIRDFAERGWIVTETISGKTRHKIRKNLKWCEGRTWVIGVKMRPDTQTSSLHNAETEIL